MPRVRTTPRNRWRGRHLRLRAGTARATLPSSHAQLRELIAMARFDHLTLPVANWMRSRDWYTRCIGLKVEFEILERRIVAIRDQNDFTIFFQQSDNPGRPVDIALYFSVGDVEALHRALLSAGVALVHAPQMTFWGYGAELLDPDGYTVRLWDERTMHEKSIS
jgi:predicted enzyme related to lactoylglutathione lyase